jgi:hypothetical protein
MSDTFEKKADVIRFLYKFLFEDGSVKEFEVSLDANTLELISKKKSTGPAWTRLQYSQCGNCPLGEDVEYCPIALNLHHVVETFRDSASFERAVVTVVAPERSYTKVTTLQKGLSSLVGLIMVTSGCPIVDKLRPMARFHLPFATTVETFYRALSMYLVAQLLLMRSGKQPDWDLRGLVEIYDGIKQVNRDMSRRLASASTKDANVNALIILHAFAEAVPFFVNSNIEELERFFSSHVHQQ